MHHFAIGCSDPLANVATGILALLFTATAVGLTSAALWKRFGVRKTGLRLVGLGLAVASVHLALLSAMENEWLYPLLNSFGFSYFPAVVRAAMIAIMVVLLLTGGTISLIGWWRERRAKRAEAKEAASATPGS